MGKLIVVGHKNPDSDSIISAIVAQEYFSKVLGKDAKAYRAGEINNETKFILENFGVAAPELLSAVGSEDSIALVDHNDPNQVSDAVDYAKVDYIVDHHKASAKTERPINVRMEPIGSTSSLLTKMLQEKGVKISEATARLLLAGILSDTLNLTSPTATAEDKNLVDELNKIAKLDVEKLVADMFKAKSNLDGISVQEIITLDDKIFEMGKFRVGVGAWETTFPESVNEKKEEIMKAVIAKKEKENLDYAFFMVADILQQNSQLYLIGEKEAVLAEKVFGGKIEDGLMFLHGVVSRKKQIIPQLTEELNK